MHGPHDATFYNVLENLNIEYDDLLANGYTGEGFFSKGYRVGQTISHNVPMALARQKALDAAENRRATNSLMTKGGIRLGGDARKSGLSLREKAAQAAEQRRKDMIWCGSEETDRAGKYIQQPIKMKNANSYRTATNKKSASTTEKSSWREWTCLHCTFINKSLSLQCELCLTCRSNDDDDGGTQQTHISIQDSLPQPTWTCPRCTLENSEDVIMCLGCDYLLTDKIF